MRTELNIRTGKYQVFNSIQISGYGNDEPLTPAEVYRNLQTLATLFHPTTYDELGRQIRYLTKYHPTYTCPSVALSAVLRYYAFPDNEVFRVPPTGHDDRHNPLTTSWDELSLREQEIRMRCVYAIDNRFYGTTYHKEYIAEAEHQDGYSYWATQWFDETGDAETDEYGIGIQDMLEDVRLYIELAKGEATST